MSRIEWNVPIFRVIFMVIFVNEYACVSVCRLIWSALFTPREMVPIKINYNIIICVHFTCKVFAATQLFVCFQTNPLHSSAFHIHILCFFLSFVSLIFIKMWLAFVWCVYFRFILVVKLLHKGIYVWNMVSTVWSAIITCTTRELPVYVRTNIHVIEKYKNEKVKFPNRYIPIGS